MGEKKGIFFVVVGPAGSGKDTLIGMFKEKYSHLMTPTVSTTTRPMREGEVDGIDYHFISREEFEERAEKGEFLEWNEHMLHYYGTYKSETIDIINRGENIITDIDFEGAFDIQKSELKDSNVTIFVMPPRFEIIEERMRSRAKDSEEQIQERLKTAREEIKSKDKFDHVLINDDLEAASQEFNKIILQEIENNKK